MTKQRSTYLFYIEQVFVLSGAFLALLLWLLSYPRFPFYLFAAAAILVIAFVSIRLVEDVPVEKRKTDVNLPLEGFAFVGILLTIPVWIGFIVTVIWMIIQQPVALAAMIEAGSIPLLVGLSLFSERIYRRTKTLKEEVSE